MSKRNLTVQVDESVVRRAKAAAARRGMSLSALVAADIQRIADDDGRYEASIERAREAMRRSIRRGGRKWTREQLYER